MAKSFNKDSNSLESDNGLTYSHVVNHNDYWFAMKMASGLPKFGLTTATAGLMWKNGAYDFWARGSFLRKIFGAGCTYRMNDSTTLSNEFLYDMKDGKGKGIMGSPLFWKYGAAHKANGIAIEYRLAAANKALLCT